MIAYGGSLIKENIDWSKLKMFLYNSAIQHTVSIEISNIFKVYALFFDSKLDLLEKWNMMQRVRTMKELFIWQGSFKKRNIISNLTWVKSRYISTLQEYEPEFIGEFVRNIDESVNSIAMNLGGNISAIKLMKSSISPTIENYEMIKGMKFLTIFEGTGLDILYETKKDPIKLSPIKLSETISRVGGNITPVHKDMRLQRINEVLSDVKNGIMKPLPRVVGESITLSLSL